MKINKYNYKNDRTICKNFYDKKKRKNNDNTLIQNQQRRNDNVNTNNSTRSQLLVGPSLSSKNYLMLKILSRIPTDRDIYIIPKSPNEQHSNSKIKNKETSDEIKPLNDYGNAIIVSDDIPGTSNSRCTH